MHASARLPEVVAHRGNAADYPENTLPALDSALTYGLRYVEFDVQLTADEVPVLLHEASLRRTAGVDVSIFDLRAAELAGIEVNEPERFGTRFGGVHVPQLEQVVALLETRREVRAFVELKRESLVHHGIQRVVARVRGALAPLGERAVVISFEREAVEAAQDHLPVGWVLRDWAAATRRAAAALSPEYLFCDHLRIPPEEPLWPGGWRWVLYEIDDPETAPAWHERGADLLETMAVARFVNHPLYRKAARAGP